MCSILVLMLLSNAAPITTTVADSSLVGLNYAGNEPENVDFPFLLPEDVVVSSGFSIADIDRDGKVEIVFGTDDCLLHSWELDSCSVGYSPWPQHRHDAGRSGVLE